MLGSKLEADVVDALEVTIGQRLMIRGGYRNTSREAQLNSRGADVYSVDVQWQDSTRQSFYVWYSTTTGNLLFEPSTDAK